MSSPTPETELAAVCQRLVDSTRANGALIVDAHGAILASSAGGELEALLALRDELRAAVGSGSWIVPGRIQGRELLSWIDEERAVLICPVSAEAFLLVAFAGEASPDLLGNAHIAAKKAGRLLGQKP